mgnify:FL=1
MNHTDTEQTSAAQQDLNRKHRKTARATLSFVIMALLLIVLFSQQ